MTDTEILDFIETQCSAGIDVHIDDWRVGVYNTHGCCFAESLSLRQSIEKAAVDKQKGEAASKRRKELVGKCLDFIRLTRETVDAPTFNEEYRASRMADILDSEMRAK